MSDDVSEIIALLRVYVPPTVEELLPRKLGGGRCLPSTRMGMEALSYFGIHAEPLPTQALAVNAAWQEWMHGEAQGQGEMPDPAWSVAVGWPLDLEKPGRGLDMHLVLLIEETWLLDLDSSQFSRPEHEMPVGTTTFLHATRREHPDTGELIWHAGEPLEGGGRLDYVEHPKPPNWRQAPDWRKAGGKPAGSVIRLVRAEL